MNQFLILCCPVLTLALFFSQARFISASHLHPKRLNPTFNLRQEDPQEQIPRTHGSHLLNKYAHAKESLPIPRNGSEQRLPRYITTPASGEFGKSLHQKQGDPWSNTLSPIQRLPFTTITKPPLFWGQPKIESRREVKGQDGFQSDEAERKNQAALRDDLSRNISLVLENLLKKYDNARRPGLSTDGPTVVRSNILVRSMGPISELDMEYSMECYFRQQWQDARLRFDSSIDELSLSIKMLEGIWKPDTFFYNGKRSYLHTITMPNKFCRLRKDGSISYSMRLTIKARCPMELRDFPLDRQFCPLVIGSYAYAANDLIYQWDKATSVNFLHGVELSQFDLISSPHRNITIHRKQGEFSVLEVSFNLRRNSGYFIIQVYIPCILIVVLSWVSFWLNREATSDRVTLGITAVLTLATISVDSRTNLPKVNYATALDWYLLMSFAFCMFTLLECAGVHFFTKVGSGEGFMEELKSMGFGSSSSSSASDNSDDDDLDTTAEKQRYLKARQRAAFSYPPRKNSNVNRLFGTDGSSEVRLRRKPNTSSSTTSSIQKPKDPFLVQLLNCITANPKYRKARKRQAMMDGSFNSVSKIDKFSRVVFPLTFGLFNAFYWLSYIREDMEFMWKPIPYY